MREYETTIIVQPEISDEGTAAILAKLGEILDKSQSERLFCENLGKRKLAYEINKFHKGHYYVLSFLSDGQVVPELERSLRLDESILRFMTILENPEVTDIEARKAVAKEKEAEQERKAAERAVREAEEAKARAEVERQAVEEAAAAAAAAAATAAEEAKTLEETETPEEASADEAGEESPAADAPDAQAGEASEEPPAAAGDDEEKTS